MTTIVAVDELADRRTLLVSGEIDIGTATVLDEVLSLHIARLHARRCHDLDVDLSEVRFFSAAGVTALLRAVERGRALGVDVRLTALSSAVARVVEISGATAQLRCGRTASPARSRPRTAPPTRCRSTPRA